MQKKFVVIFLVAVCGLIVSIVTWNSVPELAAAAFVVMVIAITAGVVLEKDPLKMDP